MSTHRPQPEPPFWNSQLHRIPLCNELIEKFSPIQNELDAFIASSHPFMDYPKYANLYINTWEAFPLSKFQGEFVELAQKNLHFNLERIVAYARSRLPVLSGLIGPLEADGHLRNVFVSRLFPGTVINPHRGWTPDFLRIHLGLHCDPLCKITVGTETQNWSDGQLLAFKDGGPYLHSVRHKGTRERIVIAFDLALNYVNQFIPGIDPRSNVAKIGDA